MLQAIGFWNTNSNLILLLIIPAAGSVLIIIVASLLLVTVGESMTGRSNTTQIATTLTCSLE
jgi:hypothetical protein